VTLHRQDQVQWTRIDDGEAAHPVTPQRFVSGISVDPNDANHAIVSYSGYDAYAIAAGTPTGHVFDVHYNPATGAATWTNITHDLGDQPITNVEYDGATGDIYASTDFGVVRLAAGSSSWCPPRTACRRSRCTTSRCTTDRRGRGSCTRPRTAAAGSAWSSRRFTSQRDCARRRAGLCAGPSSFRRVERGEKLDSR
jgi:hypothetical protein